MAKKSKDDSPISLELEEATDTDWPWIVKGQTEIAWASLDSQRRRKTDRETFEEQVAQQVTRLRREEGFPSKVFVARIGDGALAGFVWVARTHNDSTGQLEASLLSQYVAEPYRGQGLGRRLLEEAEQWARQQGLSRVSLSVGVHNTIEQRLYESLGYRVETLRMSKKLNAPESDDLSLGND